MYWCFPHMIYDICLCNKFIIHFISMNYCFFFSSFDLIHLVMEIVMLFSSALQQNCNIISIFILGFVNTPGVYPFSESGLSNAGLIHESTPPHAFRNRFWRRKCHPESLIPQTLTLWNTLLRECVLNQYNFNLFDSKVNLYLLLI